MLCILGNGRPRALLWIQITNRQEPRCFGERRIYWYHLHTYVNELADAYMGENTYMQMPKQIQMHSLASAKVRWMCIYIRTPKICKCKSNIATHMPLPCLVVSIRQASPVGCLVRICLQFIRASIHGKKNELNTEIYRNLVFSSEGIKG